MAARLTANVLVRGLDGNPTCLEVGTDLPDWAQDQVGDHVLDGTPTRKAPSAEVASSDGAHSNGPPPRAGAGSSRTAWAQYADSRRIDYDEDANRDDIVAACVAAGVPTE